jgi:hypothetical protein
MKTWQLTDSILYRRLMLIFQVDPALLTSRLPPGWQPPAVDDGNLAVGLCEVLLHLDADGNPVPNPTYHYAPINGDAFHQQSGEQANMRYLTLSDRPEEDVSHCLTATVRASHSMHVDAMDTTTIVKDSYKFIGQDGTIVSADVVYGMGGATLYRYPPPGMMVRCPDDPIRVWLYRNEELHETLFHRPSGLTRFEHLEYQVKIPMLSEIFNGSETLVGIIAVPWSRREVFAATPALEKI